MAYTHWLIKAEPETRIERGVDVKFSIDDLEQKHTTTWEGVRNHQAKKFLRDEMKLGHECLFYASNCKEPGVRGIARVCKEGYPDYNAWDPKHPYYDPKSNKDNPTWYMVDVEFVSRLTHPVPLALLQLLATHAPTTPATQLRLPPPLSDYLTTDHLSAIADSALISRGRLSVQPVSDPFWDAVVLLGEHGGWDEWEEWNNRKKKGGGGGGGAKKKKKETRVSTDEEKGKAKGEVMAKASKQEDGEAEEPGRDAKPLAAGSSNKKEKKSPPPPPDGEADATRPPAKRVRTRNGGGGGRRDGECGGAHNDGESDAGEEAEPSAPPSRRGRRNPRRSITKT